MFFVLWRRKCYVRTRHTPCTVRTPRALPQSRTATMRRRGARAENQKSGKTQLSHTKRRVDGQLRRSSDDPFVTATAEESVMRVDSDIAHTCQGSNPQLLIMSNTTGNKRHPRLAPKPKQPYHQRSCFSLFTSASVGRK